MASKAVVVGGIGAAVSCEDVLRVALGAPVALDAALMEKLERDAGCSKAPKEAAVEGLCSALAGLSCAPGTPVLDGDATRAVLFVKLGELARSRAAPSPSLLRLLAALINDGRLPALPACVADAPCLAALADAALGSGEQLPALSPSDRAALLAGSAPSVALAALAVARARKVVAVAEAVSCLSCEALQSNVTGFEAEAAEACPHKHDVLVAAELCALLEGSKCVNPRKGGATPPSVAALPQLQGRAREALQAAGTALRVELNAQRAGREGKAPPQPDSHAAVAATAALLSALAAIAAASAARCAAMGGAAQQGEGAEDGEGAPGREAARIAALVAAAASAPGEPAPALAAAAALAAQLPRLCDALSREMRCAAAAVAALEAAAAGRAPTAPAAPDGPTDPAVLARDKKSRAALPVLGRGSALVRAFADAGGAVAVDSDAAAQLLADMRALVEANASRRKPKIPKGTRDFLPEQMAIRERAFATIVAVFKRHGAVALDTPVFELRETLMGKYGEDSKLIYDLADQGGEILSLRYDLTVPFARYLAMHAVGNIKRYHIARVYRRDNPQMSRGRFREFYQCDFDIAGSYPAMMADAEALKVMSEILGALDIGAFAIKVNHRKLLDAALEVSGVPPAKFRAICSAVDKLDKEPWSEVRREMVEEKGLSEEQAERVGTFVQLRSPAGQPRQLLAQLSAADGPFGAHAGAAAALGELSLLFDYLEAMGALPHFSFDMSLARGLDYYTGVIYEAVLTGCGSNVGSIGGGGRYDTLVGMFSGKAIPAVGLSVGIERIFNLLEERERAKNPVIRATQTQVLVASIGPGLAQQRMALAAQLWAAGLKAEYLFAAAPNMQKQLTHALETGIPLLLIFGEEELQAGMLKLKRLSDQLEVTVPRDQLLQRVCELLGDADAAEAHVVVS